MDTQNGYQTQQQNGHQETMLNEVTHLLCQAQAVQIRNLQSSLPEIIQQTTRALEENQPELAHSIWKQFVQNTQTISHLFNQTTSIMYGGQRQSGRSNRYTGRQTASNPQQLNRIVRQVTEQVLATV